MISLARQNLHGRRRMFLGTFVALAFGVALVTTLGLVLAAASGGAHDGPGRFADAPVIVRSDPDLSVPDSWGSTSVAPLAQPDPLPSALVARLEAALGAGNVVADRSFPAQTPSGPSGQVGHGWSAAVFGGYRLLPGGSAPAGPDEVVLPAGEGIAVGSRVTVLTAAGPAGYLVSGLTAPVPFESAVFFSDAEAARLSPPVDDVVVYSPGAPRNAADTSNLAAAVRQAVGGGDQVLAGDARAEANPRTQQDAAALVGVSTMLGLAAGVGGFVAVLVIGSTFAFSVNQRRRELALLRLAGTTPGDMRALLRGEALLVGAVSGVAGCGLGLLCAPALARWMVGHALAPASFRIGLGLADLLVLPVAFALGLALAVLGVALAAFRAGRIAPMEALRASRAEPRRRRGPSRWLVPGTVLVLLLGTAIVGSALVLPPSYWAQVAPGLAVTFVAAGLLMLPWAAPWLARAATAPPARSRGAGVQLVRASLETTYRTAATAAPIFLTIGLFCCLWTAETEVQSGA
jgi:putative ABC transport system permease protein